MTYLEEHSEELGYDIDFVIEYLTRYGETPPKRLEVVYLGESSDYDERMEIIGRYEAQFMNYQDLLSYGLYYKSVGENAIGDWTTIGEWAWK